ncbi:uncharacterized protein [Antedon mediterranea]|uniref:uncharacterized protein isoform X1 n=1 Tax=Antedon mediterranea TaxID=105859 RepID=UPI003AF47634
MMMCLLWLIIGVFVSVTEAADGDVQLIGSPRTYMGRVEIEVGSTWYSVCDVGWGIEEADVVCRQLGFQDGAMFSSVTSPNFGQGTGNMLWSNYTCSGSEGNFQSCGSGGLSSAECTQTDIVSIICNVPAYLGCYDIPESQYPPDLQRISTASASIYECLDVCRAYSTYAALGVKGDQNRCFCFSGEYTSLTAASNGMCNTACIDDDRAACGGVNHFSIYPVSLGESGTTYTDDNNDFIYSPNFFGKYEANLDVTWTLSYTEHSVVTLNAIMFLVKNNDLLTVSDGIGDPIEYDSFQSSFMWTSDTTQTVTIRFTTDKDSIGNFGFILEYSATTSDPPTTIEAITTKKVTTVKSMTTASDVVTATQGVVTTAQGVVTTPQDVVTTAQDDSKTITEDPESKTTLENDGLTRSTTASAVTSTTDRTTEAETKNTTPVPDDATVMTTEPECPVLFGSRSISNQLNTEIIDQLILPYDKPFECDTVITDISLYASKATTYTLLVISQSQNDFKVISKVDITTDSPNQEVDKSLTAESPSIVAYAGNWVAFAFTSGSFSYSDGHNQVMNFTVYDIDYSNFNDLQIGETLDLPDSSVNVEREYPFKLTMRTARICTLPDNPKGGSYSESSLLESQSTKLVCYDGFRAKFYDESDEDDDDNNDDHDYVNVTCVDGDLVHNGYCKEESHNTTYIVIFTTIVACLGFCLIIVYFAIMCSKPDRLSGSEDVEKSPSDENILLPMDDPEDDIDYADAYEGEDNVDQDDNAAEADNAQEGDNEAEGDDEAHDYEEPAESTNEPEETGTQDDGNQSNHASSAGEVGDVDNPLYQSNEAMNTRQWEPEEAGPDD